MNAFIFWSVHRFFAVRLRTARQRSWLTGSGGLRHPGNCGKLLVIKVAQHPPLPGSGVGLPPQREFKGSALNGTLPNFCFWYMLIKKRKTKRRNNPDRSSVRCILISIQVSEGARQTLVFPIDPLVILFLRNHRITDRTGFTDGIGIDLEKRGIDHIAGVVAHDPVPGPEAALHDVSAVHLIQLFIRQFLFSFPQSPFLYPPSGYFQIFVSVHR